MANEARTSRPGNNSEECLGKGDAASSSQHGPTGTPPQRAGVGERGPGKRKSSGAQKIARPTGAAFASNKNKRTVRARSGLGERTRHGSRAGRGAGTRPPGGDSIKARVHSPPLRAWPVRMELREQSVRHFEAATWI